MQERRPRKPQRKFSNIEPRWSKRAKAWWWRAYVGSGDTRSVGPARRTQKEAHADSLLLRQERGRVQKSRTPTTLTLGDAFERTIEALEAKSGSPHTAAGYRSKFRRYAEILETSAPVALVTSDHVRQFVLLRMRQHKVSPNTVRGDLAILHRVFSVAGIPGHENPARREAVERPEERRPRREYLNAAEVRHVVSVVRNSGMPAAEHHADIVELIFLTGLRALELERLRSGDFEFFDGGGGMIHPAGKRGGTREVAFSRTNTPLMQRVAESCVDGPPMLASTLSTMMTRWQRRLGMRKLTARALRRSFATDYASEAGLKAVQDQLGHSSLVTTNRYLGLSRADLVAFTEARSKRHAAGDQ